MALASHSDRPFARRLIIVAWPAKAMLEVIVMVYCRASYFLLHDAGAAVQGEFAAADRLVKPILALASAVVVSSLPTIAGMAARKEFGELIVVYKRSVARIVVTLTPIAIAACLLMPYLLRRFAPIYADASSSFRILTVGAMFMFLNQLSSAFIVSLGKFRLIMTIAFVNLGRLLRDRGFPDSEIRRGGGRHFHRRHRGCQHRAPRAGRVGAAANRRPAGGCGCLGAVCLESRRAHDKPRLTATGAPTSRGNPRTSSAVQTRAASSARTRAAVAPS